MKTIWSSAMATTAMTAFSYIFSFITGANLKEPYILGQLYNRLMPWQSKRRNLVTGWLTHYAVGLLFTELYSRLWHGCEKKEKKNGLVFGGIAGLAAILIWKFTLTVHPFAPRLRFELFALNLFLGHLIFGFVTSITSSVSTN